MAIMFFGYALSALAAGVRGSSDYRRIGEHLRPVSKQLTRLLYALRSERGLSRRRRACGGCQVELAQIEQVLGGDRLRLAEARVCKVQVVGLADQTAVRSGAASGHQ
jgi:hypothetical protein